jgi:hypothetical protein
MYLLTSTGCLDTQARETQSFDVSFTVDCDD